jgi:hypothetical protein
VGGRGPAAEEEKDVYQHTKLYEFSVSMKLLLSGTIVAVCVAVVLAVFGLYHACRQADGDPGISFHDIKRTVCGARRSVLEQALDHPERNGLGSAKPDDLEFLRTWRKAGAPRTDFPRVAAVLEGSRLLPAWNQIEADASGAEEKRLGRENAAYDRVVALAHRPRMLSNAQLGTGTALYVAIMALVLLALGLMFVRSSLFEKTKLFFVVSTFALVAAAPLFLWLGRTRTTFLYLMLLAGLLLVVCLGVLALVALYDLWVRKPAA